MSQNKLEGWTGPPCPRLLELNFANNLVSHESSLYPACTSVLQLLVISGNPLNGFQTLTNLVTKVVGDAPVYQQQENVFITNSYAVDLPSITYGEDKMRKFYERSRQILASPEAYRRTS